jgi:hypothetical protein
MGVRQKLGEFENGTERNINNCDRAGRKLHSKELHSVCCSAWNISDRRNAYDTGGAHLCSGQREKIKTGLKT